MLTAQEILKKVRELEIKSKRLTRHLFTGEYHSAFKGRGMAFREVREYYPGDDVRFIDWNVSARFNHPFSKLFEEERELTVMLMVDVSGSSLFGTVKGRKKRPHYGNLRCARFFGREQQRQSRPSFFQR